MTSRRVRLGHMSKTAQQAPLPPRLGDLACTDVPHQLTPLDMTSCGRCFGWRDDPRHTSDPPTGKGPST